MELADAANHVGENATVCGVVALTNFDADTQFWPTFLDFGKPYPDQVFTAVIFGADRAKFGTDTLQGKTGLRLRLDPRGSWEEARNYPQYPSQLTQ